MKERMLFVSQEGYCTLLVRISECELIQLNYIDDGYSYWYCQANKDELSILFEKGAVCLQEFVEKYSDSGCSTSATKAELIEELKVFSSEAWAWFNELEDYILNQITDVE